MKQTIKFIVIGLWICTSSTAFGCKLLVDNDTKMLVRAMDLISITQEEQLRPPQPITILPDETKQVNANPNIHARVTIRVGDLIFLIQQIACSKNHKIKIKVSDLLKDKFNNKLFKITKKVSLNTLQFPRKIYQL